MTGWYLLWKLFLSRFRFVRELLMINNNNQNEDKTTQRIRTKKSRIRITS
jgi:hypothetical protein